jgi:hypothetical protein
LISASTPGRSCASRIASILVMESLSAISRHGSLRAWSALVLGLTAVLR